MTQSLTQQAIALVDQGMRPLQAAKQVGLAHNTLYVALKRRKEKAGLVTQCPCCLSVVSKDKIDLGVIQAEERGYVAEQLVKIGENNAAAAVLKMV